MIPYINAFIQKHKEHLTELSVDDLDLTGHPSIGKAVTSLLIEQCRKLERLDLGQGVTVPKEFNIHS